MPQPQKGICAEPNLHALYLMFNVHEGHDDNIRPILGEILNIFEKFDHEYYEAVVSGIVAIGSNYWMELYPGMLPAELAPFPDMRHEDRCAPAVPSDLFIQIRADRCDICYAIGMAVHDLLRPHVELLEQVQGFRYLDGRDLTGFVHGSGNPRGLHKLDVAIVGDDDPEYAGGSYLHVQRYRHNLEKWNQLTVGEQERIIGKSKKNAAPLAPESVLPSAHTRLTDVRDEQGRKLQLLRQSMPYGDIREQGLLFVSCANSPRVFTAMLENMIYGDASGQYDKLLDYTTAETGAAYFAPSIDFLKFQGAAEI